MDRLVGAGLVATALLLFFWVIPAQITVPAIAIGGGAGGMASSPLFFPRLMACVIALLGVFIFLRGYSRARALAEGEGFVFGGEQALRVGGTLVILIAYAALLEPVGYLLLTPVALATLSAFLGYRRWLVLLVVSIVFTVVVYAGFRWGMKIFLPEGLLG